MRKKPQQGYHVAYASAPAYESRRRYRKKDKDTIILIISNNQSSKLCLFLNQL
ncbi:MAG: hypothetical protein IKD78_06510 [Bacteroidales bacterium]|jgi:hypothetical protein|nr:hypothetical protein [Bacteroidales bacterium]